MKSSPDPACETDPMYPSGPWIGFFLQPGVFTGRVPMQLSLTFRGGSITGEGLDPVGEFVIRGSYQLDTGDVTFHKRYIGAHHVFYRGANEGKGIWGVWEIPNFMKGGFHIWPKGMSDPTRRRLSKAVPVPVREVAAEVLADV